MDLEKIAKKLGICQFDLFRQAYAAWYQDGPQDELVGRYFMNYMESGDMPHWVRLFAESVGKGPFSVRPAPMKAVA